MMNVRKLRELGVCQLWRKGELFTGCRWEIRRKEATCEEVGGDGKI